ncbi:P-loop NTPase fold protein [Citrobacter freundii]|uniref:P-loop NTPase fold protein n=1 Tax=Citrobacter freundii TaxID=546 RepID=UPI00196B0087|nr:P-loop NTPase fold protein [Citrobacter freundii]QSF21076.1 hypothetical protein GHT30_03125 [Citrobacter freundii]
MSNEHIKKSIDFYVKLNKPGYAILLSGAWGAGKTYFITHHLPPDTYHYISLFGLHSVDDIYAAVYSSMHPKKNIIKRFTRSTKDVEIGYGGLSLALGDFPDSLANSIMREKVESSKVIIFDDLERSTINTKEILGAINKYVEHHGCRVIAIAHDEELSTDLTNTKEKVIGLTLKVTPDIHNIYSEFTKGFRFNNLHKLKKLKLAEIFLSSGCQSLRILKHTIEDTVLLLDGIDKKLSLNEGAMVEALSIFIALNIEYRMGNIKENDLIDRNGQIRAHALSQIRISSATPKEEKKEPVILQLRNKYNPVNITTKIISDSDLINALFNGHYNFDGINQSISRSSHFVKNNEKISTWNVIFNFDTVDDITLEKAIIKLNEELNELYYTSIGEILHVFHMKYFMAEIGAENNSFDEVDKICKTYVINLLEKNSLPTPFEDDFLDGHSRDSYMSCAFICYDSYRERVEFIKEFISEQQFSALRKKYPQISNELLDTLKSNPESFCGLISSDYSVKGKYLNYDVMSQVDVVNFVTTWLDLPRKYWRKISDALEYRYGSGRYNNDLANEQKWIKDVINELESRASTVTGFERFRIQRIVPTIPEARQY